MFLAIKSKLIFFKCLGFCYQYVLYLLMCLLNHVISNVHLLCTIRDIDTYTCTISK